MKLIVAGYGFVGKAVKFGLKEKHEVVVVDPKYTDITIKDHYDADGIIICVGTPSDDNGGCDISNILDVINQTPIHIPILIKSTVSPDKVEEIIRKYTEHSIVFSPEFLRANSANEDFLNQKYMIIGGEDPENFWNMMFLETLPNLKVVHKCNVLEASLIKYATNSFLATKVSFFNQLYDVCDASKVDFETVRHMICQDPRIGTSHSMVPGIDGERGWGGHCFPKDTSAFIKWSNTIDSPMNLVESAVQYNKKIRKSH